MPNPSFRSWLRQQENRDDGIGDLARDVAADWCLGSEGTVRSIREHMVTVHDPVPTAMDALARASREWHR